jgi:hypothetical protein
MNHRTEVKETSASILIGVTGVIRRRNSKQVGRATEAVAL